MDGQKFLTEFLEAGRTTVAQDTMKDGFATLVDSEGQPYVANLNPKEKERYSETKKPLSKVKKEKGEEGKKEPEAKKTEEKKKPESEKKGGAEVIELHPEKAKKYKVYIYGKEKELTKAEVEDLIARVEDSKETYKRYVKDWEKDIKSFEKEKVDAEKIHGFWSDYQSKGGELTPQQFFDKNRSAYKITNREDLKEIADDNIWPERVKAKVAVSLRRIHNASRGIEDSKTEHANTQKTVKEREAKIAELKKTIGMAQDSLDTFLKDVTIER